MKYSWEPEPCPNKNKGEHTYYFVSGGTGAEIPEGLLCNCGQCEHKKEKPNERLSGMA